jgi:hypothetical protein
MPVLTLMAQPLRTVTPPPLKRKMPVPKWARRPQLADHATPDMMATPPPKNVRIPARHEDALS